MISKREIKHDVEGEVSALVEYIIPRRIDENNIILISTVWDEKNKKGETLKSVIPMKSLWKLRDSPTQTVKKYKTEKSAYASHRKIVKKHREERNGRSNDNTCVNTKKN